MALTQAVCLGVVGAVAIPFVAERADFDLAGLLTGQLVRIPFGGIELHWSWLVFCVVTLIAWASLKAVELR